MSWEPGAGSTDRPVLANFTVLGQKAMYEGVYSQAAMCICASVLLCEAVLDLGWLLLSVRLPSLCPKMYALHSGVHWQRCGCSTRTLEGTIVHTQ